MFRFQEGGYSGCEEKKVKNSRKNKREGRFFQRLAGTQPVAEIKDNVSCRVSNQAGPAKKKKEKRRT